MLYEKPILTLTGPSCSGKSTMEKKLKEMGFASVISTTTRPPRAGEVDGVHYHFVDRSQFKRLDEQGQFIERVEFGGNLYAAGKADCERAFAGGKPVVIVVEPEGLKQIAAFSKKAGWHHTAVFVDIDPQVQLNRFIARTLSEFQHDDEVPTRKVRDILGRLRVLNNEERDWKKQNIRLFDYIAPSFNEGTEGRVLKTVAYLATGNHVFLAHRAISES